MSGKDIIGILIIAFMKNNIKPMSIPERKMKEFTELFQKKTGTALPHDEAVTKARVLLRTIQILYKPIRKCDYDAVHSNSLFLPFKTAKMKKRDYSL